LWRKEPPKAIFQPDDEFLRAEGRPAPAPQRLIVVRPQGAESSLNWRNHVPVVFDCQ
jgi:hypothetical protein